MFCPNCGTQNADNVAFCAGCGTKLAAEQPIVQQPTYQAPEQPVYQAPVQPQQPVYQQPIFQAPIQPQQPVYQAPYQQPVAVPGKGMGIAAMVLGILSLVFFCLWYIAIPCALVGVILGGVSASKAKQAGMKNGSATAGIVCSCIALGLAVLFIVLVVAGMAELTSYVYSYY